MRSFARVANIASLEECEVRLHGGDMSLAEGMGLTPVANAALLIASTVQFERVVSDYTARVLVCLHGCPAEFAEVTVIVIKDLKRVCVAHCIDIGTTGILKKTCPF